MNTKEKKKRMVPDDLRGLSAYHRKTFLKIRAGKELGEGGWHAIHVGRKAKKK